jgi:hypothetical protein
MIYIIKTILIILSINKTYKAIVNEDFNYLYDGTIIGLLGILIKPI